MSTNPFVACISTAQAGNIYNDILPQKIENGDCCIPCHFSSCMGFRSTISPSPFIHVFSVFAEILPVREPEPTREPAAEAREPTQPAYGTEHVSPAPEQSPDGSIALVETSPVLEPFSIRTTPIDTLTTWEGRPPLPEAPKLPSSTNIHGADAPDSSSAPSRTLNMNPNPSTPACPSEQA